MKHYPTFICFRVDKYSLENGQSRLSRAEFYSTVEQFFGIRSKLHQRGKKRKKEKKQKNFEPHEIRLSSKKRKIKYNLFKIFAIENPVCFNFLPSKRIK